LSETVNIRKRGARVSVHHTDPVQHELPVLSDLPPIPESPGPLEEKGLIARVIPAQSEEGVRAAYHRGVEEGRVEAERRVTAGMADQLHRERERVDAWIEIMRQQFADLSTRMEKDALRFALAVAGKILRRQMTLDDEAILRQVREALHRVVGAEVITLRVHPDDEPMVRKHKGTFATADAVREMIIEIDGTIERGGCIIESPSGNIDARIATQLAQIESALFGQGQREGGHE
jgi:flagellar biosynthesis/type III secretory pathway protein FliH